MKKVRNYLSEVLEMKSNEVWLSFEEKCEFLGVGVTECKKTRILKIDILSPLKTVFFCISWVSDLRDSYEPTCEICRCIGQILASQVWVAKNSQETHETLCLKFLRNWNFLRISQLEATRESSCEKAKNKFF